jgi:hypothetical protein
MVQLLFSHLLYDIEQQTYSIAEARQWTPEQKAEAQMDNSDHLNDMAMRWCEEGCAMLKAVLKDKMNTEDEAESASDELVYNTKTWTFDTTLSIDAHTQAMLFHRFVVAYAMWQWARMHAPAEASAMEGQLAIAKKEVEKEAHALGTPKKIRPKVFDLQAPEIEVNWTD